MKLLLDTHILIWALNDDPRLPKKARELLLKPENSIYYSVVSIWEVAIKHAIHPENVTFTGRESESFSATSSSALRTSRSARHRVCRS